MYVNCDKCGGKIVLARIGTLPETLSVVGTATMGSTSVEAHVCTECGYMALYAADPRVLQPNSDKPE